MSLRRSTASLFLLLFVFLAACSGPEALQSNAGRADDPVVARIGEKTITHSDVMTRFERTSPAGSLATRADYEDFLQRYVDYRLKVRAGEEAGYQNDPDLRAELRDYKNRIATTYILEEEVTEPILRTLFERQQEIVDASHILLRVETGAPDAVVEARRDELQSIRDSIAAGADFGEMALRHSEDPSSKTPNSPGYEGRLGYFTGGQLVAPFEEMAWSLPVDSLSPVFRTRFGFHILTVHDRTERPKDRKLAHIMLRENPADRDAPMQRADSLYALLQDGADFAELAAEYSEDARSAAKDGVIGFVPFSARLPATMKEVAFAMPIGSVSEPVESPFGVHIIKAIETRDPASYEETLPSLKKQAAQMPRLQNAVDSVYHALRDQVGLSIDTAAVVQLAEGASPDSLYREWKMADGELASMAVATVGQDTVRIADLQRSLGAPGRRVRSAEAWALQQVNGYVRTDLLIAELERRARDDEEFAAMIEEFTNGLIMFQVMEDSVWTPAAGEKTLRAYHSERAGEYILPPHERIVALEHQERSLVDSLHSVFEAADPEERLALLDEPRTRLQFTIDTLRIRDDAPGLYESVLGTEAGTISEVKETEVASVFFVSGGQFESGPGSFDEVRARVATDLQQQMEQEFVERLRERYDAELYPSRAPLPPASGERTGTSDPTTR